MNVQFTTPCPQVLLPIGPNSAASSFWKPLGGGTQLPAGQLGFRLIPLSLANLIKETALWHLICPNRNPSGAWAVFPVRPCHTPRLGCRAHPLALL